MGKNVLIPLDLLERIVELLGYWDISGYDRVICDIYDDILNEIELKTKRLELRKAYSKIIQAKDGDARDLARMDYLWLRRDIAGKHDGGNDR